MVVYAARIHDVSQHAYNNISNKVCYTHSHGTSFNLTLRHTPFTLKNIETRVFTAFLWLSFQLLQTIKMYVCVCVAWVWYMCRSYLLSMRKMLIGLYFVAFRCLSKMSYSLKRQICPFYRIKCQEICLSLWIVSAVLQLSKKH